MNGRRSSRGSKNSVRESEIESCSVLERREEVGEERVNNGGDE